MWLCVTGNTEHLKKAAESDRNSIDDTEAACQLNQYSSKLTLGLEFVPMQAVQIVLFFTQAASSGTQMVDWVIMVEVKH